MLWMPMLGLGFDSVMEPELLKVLPALLGMEPELLMVPPTLLLMVPELLKTLELSMMPPELLLMIPLVLMRGPLFDIVMVPELLRMA